MFGFAVKRLLLMVPVLLFLTAVIFVLNELSPVDQARAVLGNAASDEQVEEKREELGLNDPLPTQYVNYVSGIVQGDLGTSARLQQPVSEGLREAFPNTLELAAVATILTVIFGTLLGLASAGRWRGANVLRAVMVSGASAPTFLLGIAGILIFFSALDWLPASGTSSFDNAPEGPTGFLLIDAAIAGQPAVWWDALEHIIMPAIAIALIPAVAVGRTLRSGLITAMNSDYVRTARSKGLTERKIIVHHGLRNAVGPALAMLGLQSGLMLSGVVVVELVFAWPGIGLYAAQAIPVADFPVIAGVALVIGATYVIINAVVDVLQAVADPRIRL
ncbi:ABC transporter permease [Thermoleophilia bacterium SCSIO 60948]|nr:ABC transporter permease [Thermoleophilia bacterium SCSIO 60948]